MQWSPLSVVCFVVLGSCCWSTEVVHASILCACSTTECQRDVTTTCVAETFCYVQIIPPSNADRITPSPPTTMTSTSAKTAPGNGKTTSAEDDKDEAVRGCIDDSTPLLCENRRPLSYVGTWPVLLCCRENWCNQGVVPTLPAWAADIRDPKNATVRAADRKYDPAIKSATLPGAYRHTGIDENDYGDDYYQEYDDNNDGDRLPVPQGGRPSRVDDLGRDSAAKNGRREPVIAGFSIENPSSDSHIDGSGVSGRHRGISPASDAVDPLFVGLTAAVACVLLAVGAALVLIVAARTSSDRGGGTCGGRLCQTIAAGDRLHKVAELPLYRCRCSAERVASNRSPSPVNVASTPFPSSTPLARLSSTPALTPSDSERTFSPLQEPLLLLVRRSDGIRGGPQLPDQGDRKSTFDEPTAQRYVEMPIVGGSTSDFSRRQSSNCLSDGLLQPDSRRTRALGSDFTV